MSALENLGHPVQVLNYNLDLAHSILVHGLQALSQPFEGRAAAWKDYGATAALATNL